MSRLRQRGEDRECWPSAPVTVVTYDRWLGQAASAQGLQVAAPV